MDEKTKNEIKEMEENPNIKTIDENYENLKAVITALTQDYEKFKAKKVKAAGQRVRASLLNTKKLCDIMRKQVIEDIRALPIKHRKSSDEDKSDSDKVSDEDKTSEEEEKKEEHPFVKSFKEHVEVVVEEAPKRRRRKANKVKD